MSPIHILLGFFRIKSWNVQETRTDYRPICRIRFCECECASACVCLAFFHSNTWAVCVCMCVLEHICVPGSRLFAYFALIMFYGTIASLWMLLQYNPFTRYYTVLRAYLQTKHKKTHIQKMWVREREREKSMKEKGKQRKLNEMKRKKKTKQKQFK